MSERAPYSRVYWSIVDDPKFATIYDDDRHLATWLRLLLVADQAHPASAPIPHGVRKVSLTALVDAGLVDLGTGHRYRIRGLDAERARRKAFATSRPPSGGDSGTERDPNGFHTKGLRRDEGSKDEVSRDEPTRARDDLWSDPEGEALVWLARHGCDVRPGNGYHQKLVVAVERHGVNAVIGMMDRLAAAGTRNGDIKGFLFGAIDALDARDRPKLSELEAQDRAEERDADFARRVARTRERNAGMRAVIEQADARRLA